MLITKAKRTPRQRIPIFNNKLILLFPDIKLSLTKNNPIHIITRDGKYGIKNPKNSLNDIWRNFNENLT